LRHPVSCYPQIIAEAAERKDAIMPQMFDWIFFAIVIPIPAYLFWDWRANS